MNDSDYVVVIGAANIDIGGSPYHKLIRADSNPGRINISYGGVGRNIAENLSKLGVNVKLVAAVGNDTLGKDLIHYCNHCGIDTNYIIKDNSNSSIYLFINNTEGDMALALSDVNIAEKLTPSYIDSISDVINHAKVVVMDCNVTQDTFLHLKEICKVPIFIDPVSQTHASKIKNHLKNIDTLKPNRLEAEFLTDTLINNIEDYKKAAQILMDKGVNKVFISMGSEGMFAAYHNEFYIIDRYPVDVVSTTGAGDSAAAAMIWSLTDPDHKNDIVRAAKAANAAASMTVESDKTINPDLCAELINERLNNNKMKILQY